MRILLGAIYATLALGGSTALAQVDAKLSRIMVRGSATVETPPTHATVSYSVNGEGRSAEASSASFIAHRQAVEGAFARMGVDTATIHSGKISILEARSKDCDDNGYASRAQLSTGRCAIEGYVTQATFTIVIEQPEQAGTLVALAGKSGGSDAKAEDFFVSNKDAVQQDAAIKALANAKATAETIAKASGRSLGPLIEVRDTNPGGEEELSYVTVTAQRNRVEVHEAPVEIKLAPEPIKTTVRLFVTYAINP